MKGPQWVREARMTRKRVLPFAFRAREVCPIGIQATGLLGGDAIFPAETNQAGC